jgi:hypothetical protein
LKWVEALGGLKWAEALGGAIASPTTRSGNRIEFLIETLPLKVKYCSATAHVILSLRRQWFKSGRWRKDSTPDVAKSIRIMSFYGIS